ncbi:MAG TPA: hypothetical protein VF971_06860 [Candidatus Limnocylindrales bacterium]
MIGNSGTIPKSTAAWRPAPTVGWRAAPSTPVAVAGFEPLA